MGLDSYSKRILDQTKSNYQVVDEREQMNLDSNLKVKKREAKMNMEKARLERKKEIFEKINKIIFRG